MRRCCVSVNQIIQSDSFKGEYINVYKLKYKILLGISMYFIHNIEILSSI